METTYNISENFNPDIFSNGKNFSAAITGSRRSGKTTFLKFLVKNHIKCDEIILISLTNSNEIYDDFPGTQIADFDNDILMALISIQQEDKKKKGITSHVLVILDDAMGGKVKYSNALLKLFALGRNLNISIIYSIQSPTFLLPDHKENLDYLFIMKTKTNSRRDHIIDTFLEGNLEQVGVDEMITFAMKKSAEKDLWRRIIKEETADHGIICVNFMRDNITKFKINNP